MRGEALEDIVGAGRGLVEVHGRLILGHVPRILLHVHVETGREWRENAAHVRWPVSGSPDLCTVVHVHTALQEIRTQI
jgi:hypothetical protein